MIARIFQTSKPLARVKNPCHKNAIRRLAFFAATALSTAVFASEPAAKFEVFPSDVQLSTSPASSRSSAASFNPTASRATSTSQVQWIVPDSQIIKMDHNVARPVADGAGELKVKYQDQIVTMPVTVKEAKVERPISFRLDVMPIFMRAGCNVGSCHGAARGKDGFHLSLFGYDPEGDYERITREMGTRRINLAIPRESLLIQKGLGTVPHTGGTRFHEGDELYDTMMRWIEAGVPDDPPTVAHANSLEILPKQIVLEGEGSRQPMTVRAHYTDGTYRDVTHLALFNSNNDNSATITPDGLVTAAQTRRSVRDGALRHLHRRLASDRDPQGAQLQIPIGTAGIQLRRSACRCEAEEASDRSVTAVQRRSVPSPGLRRHHRPAPHPRGARPLHGQQRDRTSARSWWTSCWAERNSSSCG